MPSMKANSSGPSFRTEAVQGYKKQRLPVNGAHVKDASGRLVRTSMGNAKVKGGVKKGKK